MDNLLIWNSFPRLLVTNARLESLATEQDTLEDLMATAFEVVPDSWKDASIRTIKLAQTIINKSDRGLEEACATDPLPLIREACVSESNEKIHAYVRNTRSVVVKLRENFQSTNEEIKSLTRGKEALEKALEHKRKDLALNVHSMKIRSTRPPREKVDIMPSSSPSFLIDNAICIS